MRREQIPLGDIWSVNNLDKISSMSYWLFSLWFWPPFFPGIFYKIAAASFHFLSTAGCIMAYLLKEWTQIPVSPWHSPLQGIQVYTICLPWNSRMFNSPILSRPLMQAPQNGIIQGRSNLCKSPLAKSLRHGRVYSNLCK